MGGKVVYVLTRQQEEGCWDGDYAVARTPAQLFARVAALYPEWNRYDNEDDLRTDKTFLFSELFENSPKDVYVLFSDADYPRVELIACDYESFVLRVQSLYPNAKYLNEDVANFGVTTKTTIKSCTDNEFWIAHVDLDCSDD